MRSQQLECAVRERRDARTALLVAKREGEVAVVNLRAEVARLRGELEDAAVEAAVQAQQLRAAEERGGALQASADAASAEGRKQAARMRARLEELQLVCTQQAQQLQALQAQPGRQPQVQQLERQLADQAAQLEHLQRAQAAAGEVGAVCRPAMPLVWQRQAVLEPMRRVCRAALPAAAPTATAGDARGGAR